VTLTAQYWVSLCVFLLDTGKVFVKHDNVQPVQMRGYTDFHLATICLPVLSQSLHVLHHFASEPFGSIVCEELNIIAQTRLVGGIGEGWYEVKLYEIIYFLAHLPMFLFSAVNCQGNACKKTVAPPHCGDFGQIVLCYRIFAPVAVCGSVVKLGIQ